VQNNAQNSSPAPTQGEALAARVNGEPITITEFERARQRASVGMEVQPATSDTFDAMVLQGLIEERLIQQYAAQNGISVSDAEVDAELAAQTEIARASNLSLEEFVTSQMYTMDEYREVQRGVLLWNKVYQTVTATVPATATMVHSRHILVADEATAQSLIDQINQGADFAQLAIQHSLDGSTARTGGDLDWVSRGDLLQPEVEDAIFALQPGEMAPQPVRSSLGYHVIQTLEMTEGRPLDQAELAEKKQQAFLAWLDTQRQNAQIERFVGSQ
jgi:parvulin-like peptidyl-prolyl isomerase